MAVCQTDRHRGLAVLVRSYRFAVYLKKHIACRSCRRLRMAECQTHRFRDRRNLRLLLQDGGVPEFRAGEGPVGAHRGYEASDGWCVRQTAIAASRCSYVPAGPAF